jgi:toxin ParE1/3/4
MADVVFRRAAPPDLERIVRRIAIDDPGAARRLRDRILDRIDVLRNFPESAQPRPEFGTDIRAIPISRYIVFVRVTVPKVKVLRVIHSARDLPGVMKAPS